MKNYKSKLILLVVSANLMSCSLTPQQRQQWRDFNTVMQPIVGVAATGAMAMGAYTSYRNSKSLDRLSIKARDNNRNRYQEKYYRDGYRR